MLKPALAGVDALLSISSSEIGQRVAQHHNVIEAAKAAGVRRIVYTSFLHADVSPISLAVEHRETEAELKASGIPHTILRNGWYTENHTSSIGGALAGGAVIGSAGNGKFSSATRADYAEAAVAVLAGKGHEGKIYELAGDEAYTLSDFAAEISRQTGKTIPYKNLPEADYAAALAGFRPAGGDREGGRELGRRRVEGRAVRRRPPALSPDRPAHDAPLERGRRGARRGLEGVKRVFCRGAALVSLCRGARARIYRYALRHYHHAVLWRQDPSSGNGEPCTKCCRTAGHVPSVKADDKKIEVDCLADALDGFQHLRRRCHEN